MVHAADGSELRSMFLVANRQALSDSFQDPAIKQRIIQSMIEFGIGPLKHNSQFTMKVFNFTIETRATTHPDATAYNDSIKDLQVFCVHQLQRLAMRFYNDLIVCSTFF